MKYPWIDEYLMAKRGVTKDLQPEWNWIRYHIGGKMFAAILLDDDNKPYYINLKLEPPAAGTERFQQSETTGDPGPFRLRNGLLRLSAARKPVRRLQRGVRQSIPCPGRKAVSDLRMLRQ